MSALGLWKPRALVRTRAMTALLDSAMPLVRCHSMVAPSPPWPGRCSGIPSSGTSAPTISIDDTIE